MVTVRTFEAISKTVMCWESKLVIIMHQQFLYLLVSHCVDMVKASKVVPVLKQVPRHEDVWGGGIALLIRSRGTVWRWVISFTSRPLCPRGKSCRYPLVRRRSELHNWSGRSGEVRKSFSFPFRESNPGRTAHNLFTILTELPQLI
jgi:hypothetical protein